MLATGTWNKTRPQTGEKCSVSTVVDQSSGAPKPPTHSHSPNTVAGDAARDATVVSGTSPQRIGRYLLLERLGVGGMAEVYLAQQAGAAGFQKLVVLKRILPHLAADRQFVEMFAREAKVAARVSHANVVQIFELGEEGGEFYIAMEYLDGLTLHRLAASSWEQGWALPIDVVCRTIADAAVGLHAAHNLVDEQGRSLHLVHRDVSPDNLMVSKDGVTKVLDFGIAKGDLGGPKTKTGNLRGKIPFMPPEQITGEVLDARADLYALGVSMYWMLTGERPFDRQSDWHTMHAILNDVPKPPSTLNAAVSPGLDALILQLLDKQKSKRPASGREVADRLEELASPGSVGGKKTTVAFLAQLLPAAANRGNPVSEVLSAPAAPAAADVAAAEVNSTVPAYEAARLASRDDDAPSLTAPAAQRLPAPRPVSVVAPAAVESPATAMVATAAEARQAGPVRISEDDAAIRPVTTPATPNIIADVLTPPGRTGPPVAAIVLILLALVVAVVAVALRAGKGGAGAAADVVADAGVRSVVDAGAAPSPPAPPAPPAKLVDVAARGAPARIRWVVDGTVVGMGSGTLRLPVGTTKLVAEDLRWKSTATVSVVDGVANYDTVPTGVVQLVRTSDQVIIRLGDDDVSRQRKLKLVVGRYLFKVERDGKVRDVPVEVVAGKTITIDGMR